ncbi:MAG: gliding motility lipoprotein GldH [Flavobacterium sp.]|uniref:gliding motility lipoprotein GldH n=1 Tax=Flavobacterium sp. TaxID=239 RepID=UPI00122A8493|nr:gliding motility lipoprotein GldH [Flavobacterium sp.]RZJ68444.1 MAG: gliding motility lipoprotein GldH [Flavobacterium sp.]
MTNLKANLILILVALAVISCDKKRVFDEYKSVGSSWHKDSIVSFDLPELAETQNYNLFVNVRDNDKYEFSNLFLIVSMEQPKGVVKVDTLEYEMTDAEGNLLGDGFSDIKENKLFYKENVRFPKGNYKVKIRQAVRQNGKVSGVDKLEGITEVGFRIESTK